MAIQNGKERIEGLRSAMHREIDKLVDNILLGQLVKGFTITFDCGVDRLLNMVLTTDTAIKDENGNFVVMTSAEVEKEDQD